MNSTAKWSEIAGTPMLADPGRSGCAVLRDYTTEYTEWGDGPPLILVPGLAGGVALLTPLATRLASRFRVISYQLRGENQCFDVRRRFGLDDLVEDLADLAQLLGLESPTIVGVSFGGVIALEYAARYRFRVSRLAVQGADVRFKRTLLRQVASQVLRGFPLPADSPFVNQFFNLLFGGKRAGQASLDFVARECWQTDQGVMAQRFHLAEMFDLRDKLQQIAAPTLLLSGGQDVLVSPEGLKVLAARIPDVTLQMIPDAGHLAFVTHAAEMADAVVEFAKQANPGKRDGPDLR